MTDQDPIAFFFTWSTYGTWLPGDARGWVEYRKGFRLPDPMLELESQARMIESACRLDADQRKQANLQVVETCQRRSWTLYGVNCQSNHIHAVISASSSPKFMRAHLKSWCTRRLKVHQTTVLNVESPREHWWADRGSIRWIYDEVSLEAVVRYVLDEQDNSRRFLH